MESDEGATMEPKILPPGSGQAINVIGDSMSSGSRERTPVGHSRWWSRRTRPALAFPCMSTRMKTSSLTLPKAASLLRWETSRSSHHRPADWGRRSANSGVTAPSTCLTPGVQLAQSILPRATHVPLHHTQTLLVEQLMAHAFCMDRRTSARHGVVWKASWVGF